MLHKITYELFGAGTKHCITSTSSHYLYPFQVNLYIQFKSGRCQVLVTQQKVHEQAWEKGIIIQLLYLPVFYFFSSLQTTNLSWNYAAYNVKIGVSAKHKTSQMWTHLLFSLRHPCQGFLQDEISNQAVNAI
uniref:Uncharacterized protein n=1 Tax=Spongospora subterranea TaxID=70186 RepID=A0A0H5R194_9EUKA|eukprot:CRZ01574.1 hypothetical protein [Spongospora subterranea]